MQNLKFKNVLFFPGLEYKSTIPDPVFIKKVF